MKKKQLLSFVLAFMMCLSILPAAALAEETEEFVMNFGILEKYNGTGGRVVIPDTCEIIPWQAFEDCKNITELVIPASVKQINNDTFRGQTELKTVIFEPREKPPTYISIYDVRCAVESHVFADCPALETVDLSGCAGSMVSFKSNAFFNSPNVTMYVQAGSSMESYAKRNNIPYESIKIKRPVGTEEFVFEQDSILVQYNGAGGNVVIPSYCTKIKADTFENCNNITELTIPRSVTIIEPGVFKGQTSLKTVTFESAGSSKTTVNIGDEAFADCTALEKVVLPSTASFQHSTFANCMDLVLYGDEGNTNRNPAEVYGKKYYILWTDSDGVLHNPGYVGYKNPTGIVALGDCCTLTSFKPKYLTSGLPAVAFKVEEPKTPSEYAIYDADLHATDLPKGSKTNSKGQTYYYFPDVPDSHPNAQAINQAAKLNAIFGDASGNFQPDTYITAADAVIALGTLGLPSGMTLDDIEPVTTGVLRDDIHGDQSPAVLFKGTITYSDAGLRAMSVLVDMHSGAMAGAGYQRLVKDIQEGTAITQTTLANRFHEVMSHIYLKDAENNKDDVTLYKARLEGMQAADSSVTTVLQLDSKKGSYPITRGDFCQLLYDTGLLSNAAIHAPVKVIQTKQSGATTPKAPALTVENIPASGTALASTQTVTVDGKAIEFQMYALKDANGNLTNYIKLRDMAQVLSGTKAQFAVGYDTATGLISLTSGTKYASTGTEMTTPFSGNRAYTGGAKTLRINGTSVSLTAITLLDNTGGGYNYFKLRDLGKALGFNVGYSNAQGVFIESDMPYSE